MTGSPVHVRPVGCTDSVRSSRRSNASIVFSSLLAISLAGRNMLSSEVLLDPELSMVGSDSTILLAIWGHPSGAWVSPSSALPPSAPAAELAWDEVLKPLLSHEEEQSATS